MGACKVGGFGLRPDLLQLNSNVDPCNHCIVLYLTFMFQLQPSSHKCLANNHESL